MYRLNNSETEKNLLKAFAGESQAKNRYTYYSKIAKKEGYVQMSNIFLETALQEEAHAKRFFKFLESGEPIEITSIYTAGKLGTTVENLLSAASGEFEEWSILYPQFALKADEEGFKDIAAAFKYIAQVEKEHEARFRKLYDNIINQEVFKQSEQVRWLCIKCGYIVEAYEAPMVCPACLHPQSYFEIEPDNY